MRKINNTIEEEFKKYGADEDFFQEEEHRLKGHKEQKKGSLFSKLISFLIALILLIVFLILLKVGYMFFVNPTAFNQLLGKGNGSSLAATESSSSSVLAEAAKSMKQEERSSTTSTIAATSTSSSSSSASSLAQNQNRETSSQSQAQSQQESQQQPATQSQQLAQTANQSQGKEGGKVAQDIGAQLAQVISEAQKSQSQQKSSVVQSSSVATTAPLASEKLQEMSDEELVKLLLTLKPDQLEKLDVKALLLRKKKESATANQNSNLAKTKYLNNQAIITKEQKAKESGNLAQVSKELTSLIAQVEQQKPKQTQSKKEKQYFKSIQKELRTREKSMRFYIVKKGDSLSKIAKMVYGRASDYIKIYEANQDIISDPRLIYPGQRLRIPEL